MTGLEPHLLRDIGSQCGSPPEIAEKHEFFRFGEYRMMVRAFRINPEFEQAARAVKRARDATLALQFPDIPEVDEYNAVGTCQLDGVRG
jgi:hypothetical protein